MKRREMKFVAGSLRLAPEAIEAGPRLRKPAAGQDRASTPAGRHAPLPGAPAVARKKR